MGPSNDIHVSNRVKSPTSPQGGGVSRNNDRRITLITRTCPLLVCTNNVITGHVKVHVIGKYGDSWM